jgi:large subunit ribosomal protein L33
VPGSRSSRVEVSLACTVCRARNYKTTKVKKDGAAPLELKKFCKICNAHTLHLETR